MIKLPKLNFPTYQFRFKNSENITFIFDIVRKKFVVLTPEEWVRQHVIHFLTTDLNYPKSHLAVEKQLNLNQTIKRTDVLVQNPNGEIIILIECKAPQIKISQETFDQIARYNMVFNAKYLYVCNGFQHTFCQMNFEDKSYVFLKEIPIYKSTHA
jgi:hypothetical protein